MAAVGPGGRAAHPAWTLAATICASSLAFIDGSVVNVALPSIGKSLSASTADLQWTINAYLLPLSALLLFGGAAGDHYGRRRLLIGGTMTFALGSILCALAPTLAILLAARALQGIGAAMLMPNSLAILGTSVAGEARGRAIGIWASAGAIASAVGPPLGGWLVTAVDWRAIFLLNLPIAAAAIWIARRYVTESAKEKQPLDWAGAMLATISLGLTTWALTLWSSQHVVSAGVATALIVGLSLFVLFLVVEYRRSDRAMMPLSLFTSRSFVGLSLLTFLLYAALGGLLVLLPFMLIVGGGYSPVAAGTALLPFAVVMGTASPMIGRLAGGIGPRLPLTIGSFIIGIGYLLLARIAPQGSYWSGTFPALVIIAIGMAGVAAPLTTAVLASVDGRHTGVASGLNSAIARTGGLIATALIGAVIAQRGLALFSAFRTAALLGTALAFGSGLIAWIALRKAEHNA